MLTSMSPSVLIREARRTAGLTQVQLAERAGVAQSVIARLERGGGNPTLATLERVLHAAGHRLELHAVNHGLKTVDETQLRRDVLLSPTERLQALVSLTRAVRPLAEAAAQSRARRAAA
jgi:predicted transcriptional regulator